LPATDFIISSFGEELGIFGLVALARRLRTVHRPADSPPRSRCEDTFGKLLGTGLSFSIGLQLFVVVAGVTRLLPETGLTTPVLVLRGFVTARQLRPAGPATAHLGRGPPAGPNPVATPPAEPRHTATGGGTSMNRPIRRVAIAVGRADVARC